MFVIPDARAASGAQARHRAGRPVAAHDPSGMTDAAPPPPQLRQNGRAAVRGARRDAVRHPRPGILPDLRERRS
jgi:hypothetical protein